MTTSISSWEKWSHDPQPLGRIILGRKGVLQIKEINKGRKIRQSIFYLRAGFYVILWKVVPGEGSKYIKEPGRWEWGGSYKVLGPCSANSPKCRTVPTHLRASGPHLPRP